MLNFISWLIRRTLSADNSRPSFPRPTMRKNEGAGHIGQEDINIEEYDLQPPADPAKTPDSETILYGLLNKLAHLNLEGRVDRTNIQKGHGGYSDVFIGLYSRPDGVLCKVAVKKIRTHVMEDRKFHKSLAKELYIWSKLDHPRILPLEGFYIEDNYFPHFVSRWMENGTVLKYLEAQPDADVLSLVIGIAEGIDYLHSIGVVHSDIKPDNILISDQGEPLLCDFGIAWKLTALQTFSLRATQTSDARGTVRYMSKEILRPDNGEVPGYSKKADVWAFGMTIFALLTRKAPYNEHPSDVPVILAIVDGKLPSWSTKTGPEPSSYEPLRRLCQFCWLKPSIRARIRTLTIELYHLQKWLLGGQAHYKKPGRKYKFRFLREREFLGATEERIAKLDMMRACSSAFPASTSKGCI